MVVSTQSALGEIAKMEVMEKGYTKLVISVNIPYKRTNLTFCVWDPRKLCVGDDGIDIGDNVLVQYHYKENFKQLDGLTKMERFDSCPICYTNLEPMDAQRIDCPGCTSISELETKERVSEKIKLSSLVVSLNINTRVDIIYSLLPKMNSDLLRLFSKICLYLINLQT